MTISAPDHQVEPEHLQDAYEALQTLSRKWILAVLAELARGPGTHNELVRATGLLEHKPLDRALHRLVSMQLVERTVHDVQGSAPRVRYRLTARGHSVLPIMEDLAMWWQTEDSTEQ